MKNSLLSWISSIPLLLLFPYLVVIFLQDTDTAFMHRKCDVEDILPIVIERQISMEYDTETVKCQSIITRSNFYRHLAEQGDFLKCINRFLDFDKTEVWMKYGNLRSQLHSALFSDKSWNAVEETEGEVLLYKGEWKMIPYHEISNGKTRNGEEVFHSPDYAYLTSVSSEADKESQEFLSSRYLSVSQMPKGLEVSARDSSGYVLSLSVDGNPIEGEAFREGMHLSSSDITIQKLGDQYRLLCKGKGHGLGLSQYGANELAKEGKTYDVILKKYFPELELCEIKGTAVK